MPRTSSIDSRHPAVGTAADTRISAIERRWRSALAAARGSTGGTDTLSVAMTRAVDDAPEQFGVLPWRIGAGGTPEILLITSRTRQRWIVPKGGLVKGCSPVQSAAQEAFEEAGVIGVSDSEPIGCYCHVKLLDDGSEEPCRVVLFSLRVEGMLADWPEKGQRQRQWHEAEAAVQAIDEPELARLVEVLRVKWMDCAGGR